MVTYSPFYKNPNHWFKVVLKNPDSVENQEEEKHGQSRHGNTLLSY